MCITYLNGNKGNVEIASCEHTALLPRWAISGTVAQARQCLRPAVAEITHTTIASIVWRCWVLVVRCEEL